MSEKMRKVITDAQEILATYIVPDSGISEHECVNQLLGLLDGPQTREALSMPSASAEPLAEIKKILQDACDRDWEDETLLQTANIVSNAVFWRDRVIKQFRAAVPSSIAPSEANEIIEWCIRILAKHYRESRFDPEESRLVLSKAVGELRRALKMQDQEAPRSATAPTVEPHPAWDHLIHLVKNAPPNWENRIGPWKDIDEWLHSLVSTVRSMRPMDRTGA